MSHLRSVVRSLRFHCWLTQRCHLLDELFLDHFGALFQSQAAQIKAIAQLIKIALWEAALDHPSFSGAKNKLYDDCG